MAAVARRWFLDFYQWCLDGSSLNQWLRIAFKTFSKAFKIPFKTHLNNGQLWVFATHTLQPNLPPRYRLHWIGPSYWPSINQSEKFGLKFRVSIEDLAPVSKLIWSGWVDWKLKSFSGFTPHALINIISNDHWRATLPAISVSRSVSSRLWILNPDCSVPVSVDCNKGILSKWANMKRRRIWLALVSSTKNKPALTATPILWKSGITASAHRDRWYPSTFSKKHHSGSTSLTMCLMSGQKCRWSFSPLSNPAKEKGCHG